MPPFAHHKDDRDRTVMGGNVHIAKDEVARDVVVFGGNLDIEGEATGDVTVFGGNVRIHDGAHVRHDANVFGGTLTVDKGAHIDGDVGVVGGELHRDPGAHVGGDVTATGMDDEKDDDADTATPASPLKPSRPPWLLASPLEHAAHGVRLAAVLFVIGTALIALLGRRMDSLRGEVAMRPMRSIALGLVGSMGFGVLLVALCVTIIGIPIAFVVAIAAVFAVLGAMCAVLSVVGEALLRHKTENPYVHLAVGCALFVAVSWIPWVGTLVVSAVILAAIGVLVATRGAGYMVKRNGPNNSTPYRTSSEAT